MSDNNIARLSAMVLVCGLLIGCGEGSTYSSAGGYDGAVRPRGETCGYVTTGQYGLQQYRCWSPTKFTMDQQGRTYTEYEFNETQFGT